MYTRHARVCGRKVHFLHPIDGLRGYRALLRVFLLVKLLPFALVATTLAAAVWLFDEIPREYGPEGG